MILGLLFAAFVMMVLGWVFEALEANGGPPHVGTAVRSKGPER